MPQEGMLRTQRKRACSNIRNSQEQCRKNFEKNTYPPATESNVGADNTCYHHLSI
jgi:hypothetical protein